MVMLPRILLGLQQEPAGNHCNMNTTALRIYRIIYSFALLVSLQELDRGVLYRDEEEEEEMEAPKTYLAQTPMELLASAVERKDHLTTPLAPSRNAVPTSEIR